MDQFTLNLLAEWLSEIGQTLRVPRATCIMKYTVGSKLLQTCTRINWHKQIRPINYLLYSTCEGLCCSKICSLKKKRCYKDTKSKFGFYKDVRNS